MEFSRTDIDVGEHSMTEFRAVLLLFLALTSNVHGLGLALETVRDVIFAIFSSPGIVIRRPYWKKDDSHIYVSLSQGQ